MIIEIKLLKIIKINNTINTVKTTKQYKQLTFDSFNLIIYFKKLSRNESKLLLLFNNIMVYHIISYQVFITQNFNIN